MLVKFSLPSRSNVDFVHEILVNSTKKGGGDEPPIMVWQLYGHESDL